MRCGAHLIHGESFGRIRPICPVCGWIYFEDPKVAVAVLVIQNEEVLLGRRVNDPQRGLWTLPAGFIDAGEDPARAAVRECLEETGLQVEITGLHDVLSGQEHTRGSNILIVYRAQVISGILKAGDDVDQADFFPLTRLPELAFESTRRILGLSAEEPK